MVHWPVRLASRLTREPHRCPFRAMRPRSQQPHCPRRTRRARGPHYASARGRAGPLPGHRNRIDPDRWRPLISMSFQQSTVLVTACSRRRSPRFRRKPIGLADRCCLTLPRRRERSQRASSGRTEIPFGAVRDARAGRGDRSLGISHMCRRSLARPVAHVRRRRGAPARRLALARPRARRHRALLGLPNRLLRAIRLFARVRERRFGAVQIGARRQSRARPPAWLASLVCALGSAFGARGWMQGDCDDGATNGDDGTLIVMAVRISSPPPSGTSTNRPARRSLNALVSPITACTAVTSACASIGCPARIATRAPAAATSRIGRAYVVHRDAQVGAGLHGLRCTDCRRELFDGRGVLVDDVVEHPRGAARLAQCLDAVGVLAPFCRAQLLGQRITPADKLLERSTVDREYRGFEVGWPGRLGHSRQPTPLAPAPAMPARTAGRASPSAPRCRAPRRSPRA